jgi:hypothetical protein
METGPNRSSWKRRESEFFMAVLLELNEICKECEADKK